MSLSTVRSSSTFNKIGPNMILKYLILMLFFTVSEANILKVKPILYKAENLELSPYPVYLFGTGHFYNLGLEDFEIEVWDLLTSSSTLMVEIYDEPKYLRKFKLLLKLLTGSLVLDHHIMDYAESKGLKILALDDIKSLDKMITKLIFLSILNRIQKSYINIKKSINSNDLSPLEKVKLIFASHDKSYLNLWLAYTYGDTQSLYTMCQVDDLPTFKFHAILSREALIEDYNRRTQISKKLYDFTQNEVTSLRNQNWLKKILNILPLCNSSLSICVGSMHLLEEDTDSLFHLLTAEGFEVTRLSQEEIVQELQSIQNK